MRMPQIHRAWGKEARCRKVTEQSRDDMGRDPGDQDSLDFPGDSSYQVRAIEERSPVIKIRLIF